MASEKSCGHDESKRVYVSMTKIRSMLREGKTPPEEMIRKNIAELLMERIISPHRARVEGLL